MDILKIKIDKARDVLPEESRRAIDAIDWKTVILAMRAEKGYSYTQLEDLETETELLLCGLINPEDYPKELEKRMGIPKPQVDVLVNEMNEKIFKKIREELVKNIERKKVPEKSSDNSDVLNENIESREEMLKKIENPPASNTYSIAKAGRELTAENELPAGDLEEQKGEPLENSPRVPLGNPLAQKLSGSFKIPAVETNHTLTNMTNLQQKEKTNPPKIDPYREIPQ